jgi:hypothetical protein
MRFIDLAVFPSLSKPFEQCLEADELPIVAPGHNRRGVACVTVPLRVEASGTIRGDGQFNWRAALRALAFEPFAMHQHDLARLDNDPRPSHPLPRVACRFAPPQAFV